MRLKVIFYTISILLLMLLQSTLLVYARVYDVKPNLIIVFVIIVALLRGNVEGGTVGFFAGLMLDMLFGKILGFYTLLGFYLGILVGSVNKRLYRENILVVVFFTFVSSIAYETAVYVLNSFMHGSLDLLFPMTRIILPEAVYNSLVSILMYLLLIKINRRFDETGKAARKY